MKSVSVSVCLFLVLLMAISSNANEELHQAGQSFIDAFKSLGNFAVNQYKKVEDFFVYNEQDLKKKVDETVSYLEEVKANTANLTQEAVEHHNTELQKGLSHIDQNLQEARQFQHQLQEDAGKNFDALNEKWKHMISNMYDNGLDDVMAATNNGSGSECILTKQSVLQLFVIILVGVHYALQ